MTRKPLPKVISRGSEDLRKIVDSTLPNEPASGARRGKPDDAVEAKMASSIASLTSATGPAPEKNEPRLNGVGLTVRWQGLAARRRSLAQRVIERHGAYAAVVGLAPVPIANIASVAGIIIRMVKQLSELYGIPFDRDRTRALVVGSWQERCRPALGLPRRPHSGTSFLAQLSWVLAFPHLWRAR